MGNVLKHWVLLLTWTFNDYHCVGVCFPPRWCYTWFKIHNTQDAYKFMIPSTLINTTWEGLCATRSSAWASRDPSLATNSLPRPMGREHQEGPVASHQHTGGRLQDRDSNPVFLPPKLIASALDCSSSRGWVCSPGQCWPEPGFSKCLSWFSSSWKWFCSHLTRRATRNQSTQATAALLFPAQAQCILLTRL